MTLPVDACLPDLIAALRDTGHAVLEAPPGAGKTTRVPLALMAAGIVPGRILMLEPRRLAARASAERMADTLGEAVGETVGYRMRGDAKVSPRTVIEVVTEGILTRMLQSDPALPGIALVIFDEFHERSLNVDLGLALCLEVRETLRPDLMLLPMSATLDSGPVAALMGGAPMVRAEGRAFPVDVTYLDTPRPKGQRLSDGAAELIRQALADAEGGLLAFLPGEREIRETAARLAGVAGIEVRPLYGALPFAAQRAAIAPGAPGAARKVVLATAIAETSLTIEDIRVVVDAGAARRARFDPASGMSRLVTERVTHAEATQRAGRAGRVAPGRAYRMWTRGENGALAAFAPPEIAAADLAGLALELALWGTTSLAFLTPPPEGALAEARALLGNLAALDDGGRITPHGRALAALPLHPRLAHMLTVAGPAAAPLAALLSARDPLRGAPADVALRLRALAGEPVAEADAGALAAIRTEARRLARAVPQGTAHAALSPGAMAALAYPDRIAQRRKGDAARFLMSGGKGAELRAEDPLAGEPLLVATDLDGDARSARIRQAARITDAEVRDLYGAQIRTVGSVEWSRREGRVLARRQERLGALTLTDAPWLEATPEAVAAALCEGIRQSGFALSGKAHLFRARVMLARARHPDLPDMSDAALTDTLEDWLAPHLAGVTTLDGWRRFDPAPALAAMLDWDQTRALDATAPATWTTPLGRAIPIDYSGEAPEITLRIQEMFGTTTHPVIGATPLRVTLLSPAQRPLQTTTDIPGFWDSSYADVRRDMRGRYLRHPWPENPREADPTLRTKRRS